MLKISKKTEYAIIAVVDMARNGKTALTTAKDLAGRYKIPREIMGKVLQSLVRNEIITSVQGVKGGYQLPRPLDEISIHSIIRAIDGPIYLVDCSTEEDCSCGQLDFCTIKTPMEFIQSELTRFFNSITLQDFKEQQERDNRLLQLK